MPWSGLNKVDKMAYESRLDKKILIPIKLN